MKINDQWAIVDDQWSTEMAVPEWEVGRGAPLRLPTRGRRSGQALAVAPGRGAVALQ